MIGNVLGNFEKHNCSIKNCFGYFCKKNWASFYSYIWSHWLRPTAIAHFKMFFTLKWKGISEAFAIERKKKFWFLLDNLSINFFLWSAIIKNEYLM